ncbi:MAG TPA: papain-like cysteine protease family protein [Vicinamibacteria bacterium]
MLALAAASLALVALDVPFVAQEKDTCGAASLAMVLRYWDAPVSHDEIAAALVQPELHGALGSRLGAFARARGFTAIAYAGETRQLREMVAKGRPLIVAWQIAPGRFHNVVVVGVDRSGNVMVNDPAVGAGRAVAAAVFEKRWAGAARWTLLVQPADR